MDNYTVRSALAALISTIGVAASAQEHLDKGLDIQASINTRYDDNANRVPRGDSGDKETEQQNTYALEASYYFDSEHTDVYAAYTVAQDEFTRETQESDTYYTGGTDLHIGGELSWYVLDFSHELRQTLNDAQDEAELFNTRNEEIFSFEPTIRTRPDGAIVASLGGIYTKTDSDRDNISSSETSGATLALERRRSKLTSYQLISQYRSIDFDDSGELSYQQLDIGGVFSTKTRASELELGLGFTQIEGDNTDEEQGAYYFLDYGLEHNGNNFSFASSRQYTDTSNNRGLEAGGVITGSSAGSQGQVLVDSATLNWAANIFCRHCQINTRYGFESVKFVNSDEFENEVDFLSLDFSLGLSTRSNLGIGYTQRNVDTQLILEETSTSEQRYTLEYSRSFFSSATAIFYFTSIDRDDSTEITDQNIIGINLDYNFDAL